MGQEGGRESRSDDRSRGRAGSAGCVGVESVRTEPDAERRVLFLIEQGVSCWEEVEPLVDAPSVTLTLCAADSGLLSSMLWAALLGQPFSVAGLFRWHFTHNTWFNDAQRRRGLRELDIDLPGFSDTRVQERRDHAVCSSRLITPSAIVVGVLSSYRDTLLVAPGRPGDPMSVIEELSAFERNLDGNVILEIRRAVPDWTIVRVHELDTHSTAQVFSSEERIDGLAMTLGDLGVSRTRDSRVIAAAIQEWTPRH